MRTSSASKIVMPSVDDLFKSIDTKITDEQIVTIDICKLHAFKNHHFKVKDDDRMLQLESSIINEGVLNPIVVRKIGDDYEILSGHRRTRACERAGFKEVPAIVKELDDEKAELFVIESNIQREKKLPSELAYSLKKECEIRNHNGVKADINTNELVGKLFCLNARKVARMIRLTELTDELLELVDGGKIGTSAGEAISYLSKEEQQRLYNKVVGYKLYPSVSKAEELKEASKNNQLSDQMMDSILARNEENRKKIDLSSDWIDEFFNSEITDKEREDIICEALKEYFERRK